MKILKVVLIGAGNRGETYTNIMREFPEKFKVVAVVEPVLSRRNHVKNLHNIPDDLCFDNYTDLFKKVRLPIWLSSLPKIVCISSQQCKRSG